MEKVEIQFFRRIPQELISIVDQLLEENGSYNRIGDNSSLTEEIQDCLYNKQDRAGYILAFHAQIVIGTVIVFKRELQLDGEVLMLGGIGGVGTKKAYRKKGVGTAMLLKARETLENLGCDVAFLRTDNQNPKLIKLYSKIGFVQLGRADTYRGGKTGKQYEDTGGMIAPILSEKKFQQLLQDAKIFDQGIGTW